MDFLTIILLVGGVGSAFAFYYLFLGKGAEKKDLTAPAPLPAPDYVGLTGTVVSDEVTERGGKVKVIDSDGQPVTLRARVEAGAPTLAQDTEVLVLENPRGDRGCVVMANDLPGLEDLR